MIFYFVLSFGLFILFLFRGYYHSSNKQTNQILLQSHDSNKHFPLLYHFLYCTISDTFCTHFRLPFVRALFQTAYCSFQYTLVYITTNLGIWPDILLVSPLPKDYIAFLTCYIIALNGFLKSGSRFIVSKYIVI